ncbi:hypothetical protein K2Y11_11040 [bacterium]|nr:hypothetical protein [bacterium]
MPVVDGQTICNVPARRLNFEVSSVHLSNSRVRSPADFGRFVALNQIPIQTRNLRAVESLQQWLVEGSRADTTVGNNAFTVNLTQAVPISIQQSSDGTASVTLMFDRISTDFSSRISDLPDDFF